MSARDLADVLSTVTGWDGEHCLAYVRRNRDGARRLIMFVAERRS